MRKKNYIGVMDQEDLWHQDENSEEDTGEQVQVQEPLDEGKKGYKASAKVSFHIAQTPVPQLNLGYHLPQSALGLRKQDTYYIIRIIYISPQFYYILHYLTLDAVASPPVHISNSN